MRRLLGAERLHLALLDRPQELGLRRRGEIAYFIEEHRPSMREDGVEHPREQRVRVVEGPNDRRDVIKDLEPRRRVPRQRSLRWPGEVSVQHIGGGLGFGEGQQRLADTQAIPLADIVRGDALIVDEGAVRRALIDDGPPAGAAREDGVTARDLGIREGEATARIAADDHSIFKRDRERDLTRLADDEVGHGDSRIFACTPRSFRAGSFPP